MYLIYYYKYYEYWMGIYEKDHILNCWLRFESEHDPRKRLKKNLKNFRLDQESNPYRTQRSIHNQANWRAGQVQVLLSW